MIFQLFGLSCRFLFSLYYYCDDYSIIRNLLKLTRAILSIFYPAQTIYLFMDWFAFISFLVSFSASFPHTYQISRQHKSFYEYSSNVNFLNFCKYLQTKQYQFLFLLKSLWDDSTLEVEILYEINFVIIWHLLLAAIPAWINDNFNR